MEETAESMEVLRGLGRDSAILTGLDAGITEEGEDGGERPADASSVTETDRGGAYEDEFGVVLQVELLAVSLTDGELEGAARGCRSLARRSSVDARWPIGRPALLHNPTVVEALDWRAGRRAAARGRRGGVERRLRAGWAADSDRAVVRKSSRVGCAGGCRRRALGWTGLGGEGFTGGSDSRRQRRRGCASAWARAQMGEKTAPYSEAYGPGTGRPRRLEAA